MEIIVIGGFVKSDKKCWVLGVQSLRLKDPEPIVEYVVRGKRIT
jgi:hypothetical protein